MEYSPPPLFKQGAPARVKVAVFALLSIALLVVDARYHALSAVRQVAGTVLYPFQMAALVPPTKIEPATNNVRFYDAFDAPDGKSASLAAGVPTKGGRPSKRDAVVATAGRATTRTEPKLTEKMVEHWALSNARLETVGRPVKAPRFVSQQMRAQPTAVYTEGFKQQTAAIDPERFNGSAVNFLPVKKFDTLQ